MTTTVAVVGGGPAGLMAAEVLASERPDIVVTVYDRMPSVGRKFQLAGRGGLNLTHSEPLADLLRRYGDARPALTPALEDFTPTDLRTWSGALGQRAVVGTSGRVFPEAFRATPLLRAWLARLRDLGVGFRLRTTWTGWDAEGRLCFRMAGAGAVEAVEADATVLALGGASWPRTGSDGSWVQPLRAAGVDVAPLLPANVGFVVAWSDHFRDRFGGTPLKNVRLTVGGRSVRGEAMVTAGGIEGGAVYALAGDARKRILDEGSATLRIDLRPDLTQAELAKRLLERRRPKDSGSTTLRRAAGLAPVAIALLREVGIATDDPHAVAARIKDLPLTLHAWQPIERAISTAGGVALGEIDDRFMLRRRPGTFVAGEMLDWEAPTGGYLLQATFSTGVAAAHGALDWLGS